MQGVAELAADVFGTGVRIGSPADNIGGLSDSVDAPRFATVVGLVLYGAHRSAAGFAPQSGRHRALAGAGVDRFTKRIKTWLEDFF
jgi:cell division protein FtsA